MSLVKICGLTRPEDIAAANEAGPTYIGFVFAPSRRRVTPETAARLRAGLRADIRVVGVFVDAPPGEPEALLQRGIIDIVQLHGRETEEDIRALKERTGAPVIKAVRMQTPGDAARWRDSAADWLLLDNGAGGTGRAFDYA